MNSPQVKSRTSGRCRWCCVSESFMSSVGINRVSCRIRWLNYDEVTRRALVHQCLPPAGPCPVTTWLFSPCLQHKYVYATCQGGEGVRLSPPVNLSEELLSESACLAVEAPDRPDWPLRDQLSDVCGSKCSTSQFQLMADCWKWGSLKSNLRRARGCLVFCHWVMTPAQEVISLKPVCLLMSRISENLSTEFGSFGPNDMFF